MHFSVIFQTHLPLFYIPPFEDRDSHIETGRALLLDPMAIDQLRIEEVSMQLVFALEMQWILHKNMHW